MRLDGEEEVTEDRIGGQCSGNGLRACWASDVGRVRKNNEDAVLAASEDGLFAVSDGMGGEEAGEVASRLVVEWLAETLAEHKARFEDADVADAEAALRDVVLTVNDRMRKESEALGPHRKMGATVVVAFVRGSLVHIAHMGDSRAYLLRDGKLEQLTVDHSVVGVLVDRAAITREQAKTHPMRGQLLRYVGMSKGPDTDVRTVELREGDRLMLCTDGLTDSLSDREIGRLLGVGDEITMACQALLGDARAAGAKDNLTAMVIEMAAA